MANIIKRVWNQNRMVQIEDLKGMTFQAEQAGHTFQISGIDDDGNTVVLTGTPSGVLLRPDNTDVALTCSVSGGVVSATLPANCYDVPGRFGLTIFITSGSSKTAIYAAVGTVSRTSSGSVAPGTSQSVVDLINAINAAVNSIPASYSALLADIAPTYSNSSLYSVGQYAWYDGDLKRCIVPITTAESYTAAHWTSAVLGQDVSDLKSAINLMQSPTFTDGKYINASGGLADSVNWVTYEFIPVPGATKIHVSGLFGKLSAANSYNIWCYDKYKSPLGGVFVTETANTDNNTDVSLITGTEYISITTNKTKQYSGGVYVNESECLTGIDAKIFANSGDNVARVAHTTKNGIFAYTFANNVHTVSWNGVATDYFLVKYKNAQYKVGKSGSSPDYTFPDSDLTLSTSSAIALVLRPSTGTVLLRGTSTIRYDDIKIAWLYGDKTIFFENDVLFLHSNNRDKWISVVNQKNDGLFENSSYLYTGKVEVDTTNKTVTLTNIGVMGVKNAVSVISGYSQVFDYSQLQNPTYAFAVFVNSSGAYIDNVKNIATAQYGHTEKDYLLFAFYNKSFIGTQKMYPGRWFIDGVDASADLGIYKTTARIFKKVVCCGDSYTSGHIVDSDNVAHDTNQDYAWPHYMSLITGNTWVNCGKSGANVWTWQNNSRGLKKATASGKSQAYMIGLGINDSSSGDNGIPIGTTADIGTENQTYYAGLSKIVRELHTISPDSKIFLQTLPRTGSRYEPYNEAIEYIANLYHDDYNTHLIDLLAHIDLYNVASVANDSIGGHFTGIGYEQFAEILFMLMSDYINTHVSEFQDVFSIEYENEPTKEGIDGLISANDATAVAVSASTTNVEGTGKYVELNGKVYFSVFMRFKNNIASGEANLFPGLPVPETSGMLMYEHDLSMAELPQYMTYVNSWRISGEHKANTCAFVFGSYKKAV